jgi:RNA polymerase sigma-70 factor, ECF subfamily
MQIGQAISNVIPVDFRVSSNQQADITLVRSIAQGDKGAMQALFHRYRRQIHRFSLRLTRDQETAEDIVSEVFLEVWRHAGRFEARSRVSTWLLAIARNLAWSEMRRRPTEELSTKVVEKLEDSADNPEIVAERNQQSTILAHCLRGLSPAHREVIDLVYYHERSVGEVSEIVGIPQATVKTRMHYARIEIARLLERHRRAKATRNVQFKRQR